MAKKKYLEESERKLIESVNNAYIPTDWDEFEKRYHEMERYGDGKPRKVDKEKMEYIEDGLVSRGIGGNQLSSLLSTIVEESGGNPFSVDDSGKFRGLIQFSKERYPEKDFSRDKKVGWKKAVDNQLDAIVDHLNEYGGDYGFLDGGDGSGYMTGEEAKDAFWGRDSDIENVTRALTYGFVRPGDRSGTTENRTRVARLINEIIQPPVETPDILEFDYDGKHYKATKPEEVTPEMRRALMLSKLVGEKNSVELQDSLYTTFNEAYGRAKNKGAGVFMWNGKKYSTKEDGGEVKEKESSSFLDVLKKSFRARTATANLVKDIFFGSEDGKPTELNRSLFSGVDPRGEVPNWSLPGIVRAIDYAWDTLAAYIEGNYKDGLSEEYKDLPIADRVAINAWAKYNHLPYDKKLIIDNGDGTFRLPKEITGKIRTDKKQIERIYNTNKSLLEKAEKKYSNQIEQAKKNNELEKIPYISEQILSDPEIELFKGALEMDKQNLAAMDSLDKNGKAVFNEFNYSGRNLRNEEDLPLLNVMGNHTIERDQNGNYRYKDIYDFWPWFDWMTRGNIFKIEGKVPHRKDGGRGASWTKENEEDFQKWYAKVAEHKGLNPDPDDENQYYDYRTYWLENPEAARKMLEDDPEAHFTDRYKYPGHPTFSDESMYVDEEHPGGHWETVDGVGYYVPSEYTKSYIDRTIQYLAGQNEGVYVDGEYKLIPKMPNGGLSRLAPRDNTSVGHPGSAKVPPVMPSDVARNNPVISTIASFTPIIGEMLDIRDLYTSLKNNDKTGILLALTGLVPIIGGVAGNVIKRNNPFWKERIFSPEEIKRDEELVSKFPDYARPNSPMGAAVLNHEERLANNAFRKFQNIPASRIGVDPETGNVVYDFNGLDFRFVDISNADELKKISDYTGLTSEELLEYIGNNPFTSFGDHILINRKYIDEAAKKGETDFIFRDGIPHNSPQEEVVRSHEIDHLVGHGVQRESAENSGFSFDWMDDYPELGKEYSGYFRFNDNTEVAARGSQLKDYFGLTNSEQEITPEMLEYAYRHYLDDYGINNDMDLFFKSITDFKKASDWINKYSTAGLGAYWLFDRAESVKDENLQNGGLIKFSKKIDGSSIFERNMVSPWRKITRDMVPMASPSWTNKRKRRFDRKDGGDVSNITPRDNTSVGRPGPADVQPVKPSAAARENPVVPFVASLLPGIGDVIDAHDFIQAAKDKNMVGMALAAAGFIPLVGDAFQEAARFARGRRNSYVRYDAPPRRNDIKESDEELLKKMPDYARPGYPAMEALNVHRRRLSDGAYEQRTGQSGSEAKRELEGFAETFPGIYDRIFNLDYINEDDIDAARRVIEIIDKQSKGSAGTMSDEGVLKRLNDIKQRLVRSSPAFAEGTRGNAGIISLDNWSDFFMDEAYRSGISHELDHAVYLNTPEETIKELSGKVGDWFDSSRIENKNIRDYVSKPIELLARGTQIKDFYGLTDNAEKVTPEMLKFAARHYADNVMDNQMTEFFNGIKDWDKAAEWISKYSTATLPAIAVSKLLQDGKEKDEYPVNRRHGGPMSEDGSVGGDYILDDGGRSLYRRSEYIKNRLLSKYNLLPEESDGIISDLIGKSSLDEKFYDPKHKSYGIGQWSGKDLKEFVLTYKDGGLADQIDFLAKKYWDGFGKDGKGDIESGVFNDHRWVVKRIGNEEFYTNSPLLKTLPSMSREDVALSLLPPELWPGILKRKEDVTGKSARRHFIEGGEVNELQDYIYDRLTKEHGIAPIQAIGIVANLTQESALNYDALGDNGRSYGIQQWQGDRRKKLFEFAKKRGRDKPALDDQVDFLVEEYRGDGFLFPTRGENMYKTGKTDKDMFDYFQYSKLDFDNASNIYDSTRAWAQGFGRGNKNFLNMDRRFNIAKTLSSRYNIDAGGQSFYTDMGYKDEWGSPVPEVAVSAEKKAAQDDWMEKYGNKMLASILAGDGEGGDTHVTNNYYVNEEGLSEDEKQNAAEVRELQQKEQAQELLASIIDGIKLDIKGVTEVRKR